MSENAATQQTERRMPSSFAMIRTLVVVAGLAGLLIVAVYQYTLPIIKANKAEALRQAVFEVLPEAQRVETFKLTPEGTLVKLQGEDDRAVKFYAGYDANGKLAGVAIEAMGKGYQDVIRLLYGYDPEGQKIVGMKVLESSETPGLGDNIGKDPAFLSNFDALDVKLDDSGDKLAHRIEVVKGGKKDQPWQIDAITGATISSNAVGTILNASAAARLPALRKNLETLKEGA